VFVKGASGFLFLGGQAQKGVRLSVLFHFEALIKRFKRLKTKRADSLAHFGWRQEELSFQKVNIRKQRSPRRERGFKVNDNTGGI